MASFAPIRGTRAQIQATPIVDGQFLVETDQGVDNKIYMDEGSTRTIVGGNTVTGVLPELYIYSETGSVVTVEDAGGTSIPTSQVGTDHWICEVPDYGIYNIYSLLDGETTTQSINVDDCMIYTIDDSHFHCNVVVTYPSGVGASCQISGGGETYSAPALNPPDTSYKFVVHGKNTTYTITTNVDGATKTQTVTTGTTLDQTYEVTMPYARVNLTVETPPITGNVTCTDGTTTIVKAVAPNMVFYLPNTGSWTFTGSDGVEPYDITVEVNDLSVVYNEDLSSAPDGATVLPTDDIQTWLLCAKIKDKTTYTTLDDVLNDNETLQKLISSDNAMDYLVRSTTWINIPLVPILTEDDGNVINTGGEVYSTMAAWKAFRGQNEVDSSTSGWISNTLPCSVGYHFNTPVIVNHVYWENRNYGSDGDTNGRNKTYKIQASHDNSTWYDLTPLITRTSPTNGPGCPESVSFDNSTPYEYYRLYITSSYGTYGGASKLQFYYGIINDEDAMRYIGKRNYASDVLMNNSDWNEAIALSKYAKLIYNESVPAMTSNTTPSGQCFGSAEYSTAHPWWKGFDGTSIDTSDKFAGNISAATWYLGYKFTSAIVLKSVEIQNSGYYSNAASQENIATFIVQASSDSTNGSDGTWIDLSGTLTTDNLICCKYQSFAISNNTAYIWYRIKILTNGGSTNAFTVGNLQFYGRHTIIEGLNIYSAAQDTLTISDGTTTITQTTDNNGCLVITTPLIGTYTFTSSVAENPNNLGASDYYSKTITIFKGMIEAYVMPDNVLYWWGWKKRDLIPWRQSYGGTSTENQTNISFTAATSSSNCGSVVYDSKFINTYDYSKINVICEGVSTSTGNFGEYVGFVGSTTEWMSAYSITTFTANTKVKAVHNISGTASAYIGSGVNTSFISYIYAIYLE